jgi:hypothetical protein
MLCEGARNADIKKVILAIFAMLKKWQSFRSVTFRPRQSCQTLFSTTATKKLD